MQLLNSLSDAADELITVPLPDGSVLQLEFIYRAGIQRWSMNVSHPLLTLNNFNLAMGPNILRQWRNLVPFGMAVDSTIGLDPMNLEDFVNGYSLVYVLSAAEVAQVEADILAPIPLVNA